MMRGVKRTMGITCISHCATAPFWIRTAFPARVCISVDEWRAAGYVKEILEDMRMTMLAYDHGGIELMSTASYGNGTLPASWPWQEFPPYETISLPALQISCVF